MLTTEIIGISARGWMTSHSLTSSGWGNSQFWAKNASIGPRYCSNAMSEIIRCMVPIQFMILSAFSLSSFAGGIAGVASGLPFSFQGGFPRCLLGEFIIAEGGLLGFQRGLASGNLGGLRSG